MKFEGLCLIRERLVIGTRDSATRDRLLRELTVPGLTRCIEALKASELSRTHQEQLKDAVSDPQNTIDAANKQSPRNRKQGLRNRKRNQLSSSAETRKVKSMHRPARFKSCYQEAKVPNAYS